MLLPRGFVVNMMTSTRSRPRAEGEASRQNKRCLREKLQEFTLCPFPGYSRAKKLFFSLLASGETFMLAKSSYPNE